MDPSRKGKVPPDATTELQDPSVQGARLLARGAIVDGRHEVLGLLGQGATGAVYRVYDRDHERICALKWVPGCVSSVAAADRLREEFRFIAQLRHPNVLRVHDFGVTVGGDAWLSMELVDGEPLSAFWDPSSPMRIVRVAADLCATLAYVHERCIAHRDIKPQNILVVAGDDKRPDCPKLLDFGVATALGSRLARPAGTVAYMAPEVLRGHVGDGRSDLFGFGAVLYEAIAGVPPFATGPTLLDAARSVLEHAPQTLAERCADVPPRLSEIVSRLLQKEPSLRYHDAIEAAADLAALVTGEEGVSEAATPGTIGGAALVGRTREAEALSAHWRAVAGGQGGLAIVAGEQGVGKTRLVEELRVLAQLDGARVVSISCDKSADLSARGPIDHLLRRLLGDPLPASLGSMGLRPPAGGTSATDAMTQLAAAVAGAIRRSVIHPLLLVFEDVHAAPVELQELLRLVSLALRDGPVLVCMTVRWDLAGEPDGGLRTALTQLEGEPGVLVLRLDRLSQQDTGLLVRRLVGDLPGDDALRSRVWRETDGNPLLVEEALRSLVDARVLRRRAGRFMLAQGKAALETLPILAGGGIRDALLRRIQLLEESVLRVLQVAAVEGVPVTEDELALACRLPRGVIVGALREAERRGLIGRTLDDDRGEVYAFTQTAARDVIYLSVPRPARERLHRVAGQRLARTRGAGSSEAVARHFLQGRLGRRATRTALAAAGRLEPFVPSRAVALYAEVLDLPVGVAGGWGMRLWLHERIGDLQAHLGGLNDAVTAWRLAISALLMHPTIRCGDAYSLTFARLKRKQGDATARLGDYVAARQMLSEASRSLPPAGAELERLEIRYATAWTRMMQAEYVGALEEAQAGLAEATAMGGPVLEGRFHLLIANLFWHCGEWATSAVAAQSALGLFRDTDNKHAIADAHLALGSAYRYKSEYSKAATHYALALSTYEEIGALAYAGKCHNNLGVVAYLRGKWADAARHWESFVAVCERTGERNERVMLLNNLGVLYSDRADLERAEATLLQGLALAHRIGFSRIEAMLESNLGEVRVRKGRFVEAEECYRRCEIIATEIDARDELVELTRRRCELDLERNDLSRLNQRVSDALGAAATLGARMEEAALYRIRATVRRRTGLLAEAEADLDKAVTIAQEVGATLELRRIDVERAHQLVRKGNHEEARSKLGSAIEGFRELGAQWDARRAEGMLQSIERSNSDPTAADLARLLDINRKLGTILDLDDLLRSIVDVVLELTGFERAFLIIYSPDGAPVIKVVRDSGQGVDERDIRISRTVAERVYRTGQPVSISDVSSDATFESTDSVVALDLRSILCVPMIFKGTTIGVMYTDNRSVATQSLTRAQPMLEALGFQAAVAIENARLYEAERLRSDTIATVAHELKSPLTAITGYLSMLDVRRDVLEPEQQEYLRIVMDQSRRLTRMVRNILDLRAIENGAPAWSMAPVPALELIRSALDAVVPIADIQGIAVVSGSVPSGIEVFCASERVQQVITNLVSNAIKFTPRGGEILLTAEVVRIQRSDAFAPDPGRELGPTIGEPSIEAEGGRAASFVSRSLCLRIGVHDSGEGISPADARRIFEKYAQGTGERRGERGLGLGLSISREIVLRHGGRIWVESNPGEGATFFFTLPMTEHA